MAKSKSNKQTKPRVQHWRNYPESIIPSRPCWRYSESLNPTENTMIRAILGEEEARAILTAWTPMLIPVRYVEALSCA